MGYTFVMGMVRMVKKERVTSAAIPHLKKSVTRDLHLLTVQSSQARAYGRRASRPMPFRT
jgi:hypothetical protein